MCNLTSAKNESSPLQRVGFGPVTRGTQRTTCQFRSLLRYVDANANSPAVNFWKKIATPGRQGEIQRCRTDHFASNGTLGNSFHLRKQERSFYFCTLHGLNITGSEDL